MQSGGISHLCNSRTSETWFIPTGEQWRDKTPDLVNQLQITQLAQDIPASLHQEAGNPLGPEFLEHLLPGDSLINESSIPILIGQYCRFTRQIPGPGDHHAPWRQVATASSNSQSGVILPNRFRPDQDGVYGSPEMLNQPKRFVVGEPRRFAGPPGNSAVQGLGDLGDDPWSSSGDPFFKANVQQTGLFFEYASGNRDSSSP
jgi:hypothetical protein